MGAEEPRRRRRQKKRHDSPHWHVQFDVPGLMIHRPPLQSARLPDAHAYLRPRTGLNLRAASDVLEVRREWAVCGASATVHAAVPPRCDCRPAAPGGWEWRGTSPDGPSNVARGSRIGSSLVSWPFAMPTIPTARSSTWVEACLPPPNGTTCPRL
jgi:hypothetical protein